VQDDQGWQFFSDRSIIRRVKDTGQGQAVRLEGDIFVHGFAQI
jgi:hypothetical protein